MGVLTELCLWKAGNKSTAKKGTRVWAEALWTNKALIVKKNPALKADQYLSLTTLLYLMHITWILYHNKPWAFVLQLCKFSSSGFVSVQITPSPEHGLCCVLLPPAEVEHVFKSKLGIPVQPPESQVSVWVSCGYKRLLQGLWFAAWFLSTSPVFLAGSQKNLYKERGVNVEQYTNLRIVW